MIEFNADTHEYFNDGKKLISVTQLMRKHGLAPDYSAVSESVLNAKAERGTLIHAELEAYTKHGEVGFTKECLDFAIYCAENNIHPLGSETIAYNDIVAGTIDFVYEQGGKTILADFKTTSTLHKDAVSWQLSIYKALYGKPIDELKAFHFTADGLKVVDIAEKPAAEVERLFESERASASYVQSVPVSETALAELADVETLIKSIEEQKKQAEARAADLRAAIMDAMKKNGVTSFDNERMKITYVAPYTRASVDTTRLKKDHPEIYSEYQKQTTVKESLKITIKGE